MLLIPLFPFLSVIHKHSVQTHYNCSHTGTSVTVFMTMERPGFLPTQNPVQTQARLEIDIY